MVGGRAPPLFFFSPFRPCCVNEVEQNIGLGDKISLCMWKKRGEGRGERGGSGGSPTVRTCGRWGHGSHDGWEGEVQPCGDDEHSCAVVVESATGI